MKRAALAALMVLALAAPATAQADGVSGGGYEPAPQDVPQGEFSVNDERGNRWECWQRADGEAALCYRVGDGASAECFRDPSYEGRPYHNCEPRKNWDSQQGRLQTATSTDAAAVGVAINNHFGIPQVRSTAQPGACGVVV